MLLPTLDAGKSASGAVVTNRLFQPEATPLPFNHASSISIAAHKNSLKTNTIQRVQQSISGTSVMCACKKVTSHFSLFLRHALATVWNSIVDFHHSLPTAYAAEFAPRQISNAKVCL